MSRELWNWSEMLKDISLLHNRPLTHRLTAMEGRIDIMEGQMEDMAAELQWLRTHMTGDFNSKSECSELMDG